MVWHEKAALVAKAAKSCHSETQLALWRWLGSGRKKNDRKHKKTMPARRQNSGGQADGMKNLLAASPKRRQLALASLALLRLSAAAARQLHSLAAGQIMGAVLHSGRMRAAT